MKTTLRMISLDHPQFNGQTKQINQFDEDTIQVYVTKKPKKWDPYLPFIRVCI